MAIGQIQVKGRETLIRSHDLTIGGIYFLLTLCCNTLPAHTVVGMAMIKCPEGTRGNIRDMGQKSSNKSRYQSYLRKQLCMHVLLFACEPLSLFQFLGFESICVPIANTGVHNISACLSVHCHTYTHHSL